MYLYNKNEEENLLEVYSLMPKEKLISEYKKQEMEQIPENERVLKAVSNHRTKLQYVQTCSSDINYGNEKSFFRKYHRLIEYTEKEIDQAIKYFSFPVCSSTTNNFLFSDCI